MVEHLPGEELGLGVGFDEELGHVVITYISDGSAADRCGQLQVLDPLVSINGQTVDRTSDFRAILSASSAGDPVELKILVNAHHEGEESEEAKGHGGSEFSTAAPLVGAMQQDVPESAEPLISGLMKWMSKLPHALTRIGSQRKAGGEQGAAPLHQIPKPPKALTRKGSQRKAETKQGAAPSQQKSRQGAPSAEELIDGLLPCPQATWHWPTTNAGERVLVIGMGGGCDVFAAMAVARQLEAKAKAGSTILFGSAIGTRAIGHDLEHVALHLWSCLDTVRALEREEEAYGSTLLEQSCPRGAEGSPYILMLPGSSAKSSITGDDDVGEAGESAMRANIAAVHDALDTLRITSLVAVDTGGDSLTGGKEFANSDPEWSHDRQVLHALTSTGMPLTHLILGPGCERNLSGIHKSTFHLSCRSCFCSKMTTCCNFSFICGLLEIQLLVPSRLLDNNLFPWVNLTVALRERLQLFGTACFEIHL